MGLDSKKVVLDDGCERLVAILRQGPGLRISPAFHERTADGGFDAFLQIENSGGAVVGTVLVVAKGRFTPRAIELFRARLTPAILQGMGEPTVLIVAPWLSARSQQLIEEEGWSFLDLTGNVLIRSSDPMIYVRLQGADVDPEPRQRNEVMLRGTNVNGLVRTLVDVEPPYRLSQLAAATDLSMGYLSRTLKSLHEQGLIERDGSGPVMQVRWPDLLRRRASEYDLLKSNRSGSFLARSSPRALLRRIADQKDEGTTVTGSFAAELVNPVAAPVQLSLYVPNIRTFAQRHELIPARSGANVLLLEAASISQLERSRLVDGVRHVGYSQLALDLLAGNGRLPEEGEAILDWMIDTPGWRLPSLPGNSE